MNVKDPLDHLKDAEPKAHHGNSSNRVPRILLGLFLLTFLVIMVVQVGGSKPKPVEWRPMPGGGKVRLAAVTVGKTHTMPKEEVTFGQKLQQSLRRMSLAPFFNVTSSGSMSTGGSPSTVFWLFSDSSTTPQFDTAELVLPDGQVIRSYGSNSSSSSGGSAYAAHTIGLVAYTAPKFKIRLRAGTETMEWETENPGYKPDVAEWTPEPLPATRSAGGYEFTLESISSKRQSSDSAETWIQPKTKITKDGKSVKGISTSYSIRDPGGNEFYNIGLYSSKAWRLLPRFRRLNEFAFAEGEVQWIGDVAPETAPAAEKVNFVELSDALRNAGLVSVGVYGPGIYEQRAGDLLNSKPYAAGTSGTGPTTDYNYSANRMTLRLPKAALVVLTKGGENVIVLRTPEGKPASNKSRYFGYGGNNLSAQIYSLDGPMKVGIANNRLAGVKDDDVEFVVSPPAMPKLD